MGKYKRSNTVNAKKTLSVKTPSAYLSKKMLFMEYIFFCTPSTLIPRKDTEVLVNKSLNLMKNIKRKITIIEIGTGSGNIAVSLALHNKYVQIHASDISEDALKVAKQNIISYNLQNRIKLYHGDMFSPFKNRGFEKKIDFVLCNPPYIPTNKLKTLSKEIIDFEPHIALDAGPYGMKIIKQLIRDAPLFLKKDGVLMFEFGQYQDRIVKRFLKRNGHYSAIDFYQYNGLNRFVCAWYRKLKETSSLNC